MKTAAEYIDSLRKMNFELYMFGERITNHVDHPIIRPTINCVAATYELGEPCYASPAISNGQVFIRGFKHLFCFGRQQIAPR